MEAIKMTHKFLGQVLYTEWCDVLTKEHCTDDEIYVVYEGQERRVTRNLVRLEDGTVPKCPTAPSKVL